MNTNIIAVALIAMVAGASSYGLVKPTHMKYHPLSRTLDSKASGICYQVNKMICSQNCKQLFLCVQDEGNWAPILIANCTTGTYCNEQQATCTTSLSTCSPTSPPVFQLHCTALGPFPDPYDCTVFHECATIGTVSKVSACQAGWSYNALTTECDHRMSDGICFPAGVIPPCTTAGQSGPVPENTNIYYVCLQTSTGLLHELFKCAHGGHYLNGQCSEFVVTTEAATTTIDPTEPTDEPTVPTLPTDAPTPPPS